MDFVVFMLMKRIFALFFLFLTSIIHAQHQDKVDFIEATVFIEPVPKEKQITGSVVYQFDVVKDVDSVYLDAKRMKFTAVLINDKNVVSCC